MKADEIKALFLQFEQASQSLEAIECWSARELCALLGNSKWENFSKGDQALFRLNTSQLKWKMGVLDSRPVADFLLIDQGIVPENLPPAEDVK
jgi:hypothetical protein